MKRILLFIATNLAVVVVLGVVLNIVFSMLGIDRSSIGGLLVFCAVFGFGGATISLFMSKWMAKRAYNVQVITQPRNEMEHWLVTTVARQAQQAGIGMPEVGVYNSPDMNAFATGARRNDSLVAVSSGLMYSMSRDEAEAVLAHEVSHIANGDMVTLTLIQGVVNTFVMFFARIVANIISSFLSRGEQEEGGGLGGLAYFGVVMVLEIVFGILASIIVMWFSRQREYRADEGAARLVGKEKMIAALERLRRGPETELEGSLAAFGINGKRHSELFMSHPPIEKRIQSLRELR
ncbi:zinc metalloprotease HtpX [Zobellella denitrificans]|jgi:heat shock protein HtpX|uniref:Protease HtpX n=1 Tax=Zobellella denitrificans TaxID=347534 RepID=A0A231N348_9GAMM|nr:protease HtpX [Zobellella denitrificans]ATG74561.1 heat-shock protein HtpX [Zobellella denitrificans]OXS16709.1 zinc metalloprotease HtpX [Zobellella denitrificans]